MARASLGAATRSEVLNVRVTPAERAFLEKGWGSGGKALRGMIDREKRIFRDTNPGATLSDPPLESITAMSANGEVVVAEVHSA